MNWLLYLRLVFLTAGTLLPFFWMVVILGHRRQRNFERIFFFLCLALTCFFGSSLLALNAQIYYGVPPQGLLRFAWTFLCLGLWFIPPLVLHLHVEYASLREILQNSRNKNLWLFLAWLPAGLLATYLWRALRLAGDLEFERPSHLLGAAFQLWLVTVLVVAMFWQHYFLKAAPDVEQKNIHKMLEVILGLSAVCLAQIVGSEQFNSPGGALEASRLLMILVLLPLGILIVNVRRFNFLQIGRQRNLIYAVFLTFLALLYLSLVRRASLWFEPYLPPEATSALLLFLPVVFFEPLQRWIRTSLRETAQSEVDRAQKLVGPINEVARLGDFAKLAQFTERWIAEQLQLAEVRIEMVATEAAAEPVVPGRSSSEEAFEIKRSGKHQGWLRVRSHGAMISGETFAALEFLCEQLPPAFDLCRLIEEKLQLERELAERERLALVGQMAASISHNLKNPLGSMKTILQVQMESAELPVSMRHETQMVLDEINRLSGKLNQLLQFSRPGVRAGTSPDRCGLAMVAENVVNVLRHEAESRGISIELKLKKEPFEVAASGEVASDILSNLVLNAMEAAPEGGHVRLSLLTQDGSCIACIEDDGPGIPAPLKDKILQPFFTTKARGTGLGLAIVTRRLEEIGGRLTIESPIHEQRGSRFRVTLPLAREERPS